MKISTVSTVITLFAIHRPMKQVTISCSSSAISRHLHSDISYKKHWDMRCAVSSIPPLSSVTQLGLRFPLQLPPARLKCVEGGGGAVSVSRLGTNPIRLRWAGVCDGRGHNSARGPRHRNPARTPSQKRRLAAGLAAGSGE